MFTFFKWYLFARGTDCCFNLQMPGNVHQHPRLGQDENESQKISLDLPCGRLGLNCFSPCLLPLRVCHRDRAGAKTQVLECRMWVSQLVASSFLSPPYRLVSIIHVIGESSEYSHSKIWCIGILIRGRKVHN